MVKIDKQARTSVYGAAPSVKPQRSHTLAILVDNEPGVLGRVIGLFSGRGYNIESLTVAETDHQGHRSRITVVTTGTLQVIEQIKAQLSRMVPVHQVHDLTVEGPSVDRLIGLENVRATLVFLRTPDGQGRIELDKFHTPEAIGGESAKAPVNALGIRRIMFAVDDIDDVVARLRAHGAELVGDVVHYEDTYRLAYVRSREGIIVGLGQRLE